jgi:glycosyltransferase involved in cell wall biosynthesis
MLARQVKSIRQQSYRNWICIICDDGSNKDSLAAIRELVGEDRRFVLREHAENVGFYYNFERSLRFVPVEAAYIALADQDDEWYPGKLAALVDTLDGSPCSLLAYSDMQLCTAEGRLLAKSYWGHRKNQWESLGLMLVANTVTGAACMFRRSLLSQLLPFPQRLGDSFHDHAIACSALAWGEITYLDQPLYDYTQHNANVIGHCDFQSATGIVSWARDTWKIWRRGRGRVEAVSLLFAHLVLVYRQEYIRLMLLSRTLLLRGAPHHEHLNLFSDSPRTILKLLRIHQLARNTGSSTDNAELRLLGGYLADRVLRVVCRVAGRPLLAFVRRRGVI